MSCDICTYTIQNGLCDWHLLASLIKCLYGLKQTLSKPSIHPVSSKKGWRHMVLAEPSVVFSASLHVLELKVPHPPGHFVCKTHAQVSCIEQTSPKAGASYFQLTASLVTTILLNGCATVFSNRTVIPNGCCAIITSPSVVMCTRSSLRYTSILPNC